MSIILVTSNSIVGAIAVYEHYREKLIPAPVLWVAVCFSVFKAVFLAWRDERREVGRLTVMSQLVVA